MNVAAAPFGEAGTPWWRTVMYVVSVPASCDRRVSPILVGVRAVLLGAAVALTAATADLVTRGVPASGPVLILLAGLAAGVAVPLLQREVATRSLVSVMCGGQVVAQMVIVLLSERIAGGPASAAVTACAGSGGTGTAWLTGPGGSPVRACASSLDAFTTVLSPAQLPFVTAHLVAAAGVGLVLARGERSLWSLVDLLALLALLAVPVRRAVRLLALVPTGPRVDGGGARFWAAPVAVVVGARVLGTAPRRGPPCLG